jgi:hypothetical protein
MIASHRKRLLVIGLMVFPAIMGCSAVDGIGEQPEQAKVSLEEGRVADATDQTQPRSDLYQKIVALANQSLQCDSDSDCELLGLGARPCGGPEEYLTYSSQSSNREQLLEWANQYNRDAQRINQKERRVGICVVAPKPALVCSNKVCIAQSNPNY